MPKNVTLTYENQKNIEYEQGYKKGYEDGFQMKIQTINPSLTENVRKAHSFRCGMDSTFIL